jgi:hypothetical protein
MGDKRGAYRILVGKHDGKRPPEDTGVDGRIILKYILEKWVGVVDRIDVAQDRGQVAGSCESGNEW